MIHHGAFDAHLRAIRMEHAKRCTQMIASIQKHMPPGSIRFYFLTRSLLSAEVASGESRGYASPWSPFMDVADELISGSLSESLSILWPH